VKVCKYPGGCEIENQKRFDAGWCSVHRRRLVRDGDPGPPGLLRDPTRVCKVDGCDGKFFAKGFCEMHYARKRKGWDMDAPRQVRYRKGQVCSQDGCDRVVSAKGFCGMHWKRNHDNRDMDAPPKTRNKQLQVLDTTVYRFTDGAGRLLYVGITFDLDQRIAQHRHSQPWWDDVCIVTSHTEPTRVDALAVEAAAIRNEKPAHNVIHNGVA